jgi:hypothetical protein
LTPGEQIQDVFFVAFFFAGFSAWPAVSVLATVFAAGAFFPQRPLRSGAAAISAWHSSSVSDFGSRSFGTLPFFRRR